MDFLRSEVESEESIAMARSGFSGSGQKRKENIMNDVQDSKDVNVPTAIGLLVSHIVKCVFCSGEHYGSECKLALTMSLELKREKLKSKRCCFTCTRHGHTSKECWSKFQCTNCNGKHVTVMCTKSPTNPNQLVQSTSAGIAIQTYTRDIFLQVLPVNVKIGSNLRRVRIVFDCGSHKSYIKSSLINEIGLEPTGELYLQKNLFGGGEIELQRHSTFNLEIFKLNNKLSRVIEVLNEKKICASISKVQTLFG